MIRFPDGETVSRREVMNLYLRQKRNHIVRLRTRPWPLSRSFYFLRCYHCRAMFQPHPPWAGDTTTFRTDVIGAESHDPCPYCGERWMYNNFDHWLRAWVAELEEDDRRYAGRQKRADDRLNRANRPTDA